MAGKIGTPVSPWVIDSGFDAHGKHCSITINFNNTTLALQSAVLQRDADCMYTRVLIGVGPTGSPEDAPTQFGIGNLEGTRNVTQAGLSAVGLNTLDDVRALGQITFGF